MINGNIGGYISCCISMLIRIQASGDKLGMLLCKARVHNEKQYPSMFIVPGNYSLLLTMF